jgi:hypothetical protein
LDGGGAALLILPFQKNASQASHPLQQSAPAVALVRGKHEPSASRTQSRATSHNANN